MAEWWVVQNTAVTPNTYTVVEQNPPAPAGAVNDLGYFNQASAESAAAGLNKSAKVGVVKTLQDAIPNPLNGILPTLSNLRDLVIRSVKVVLGAALIIIGLAKLSGVEKIASNMPAVIPV